LFVVETDHEIGSGGKRESCMMKECGEKKLNINKWIRKGQSVQE